MTITPSNSFYRYMKRFHKNSNTRFGDFARDMIEDKSFPKHIIHTQNEYNVIRKYLNNVGASTNVIDVFVDAYHEYLNYLSK